MTLSLQRAVVMGILNITPDSFSDGGHFLAVEDAVNRGRALVAAGAQVLDVGGESTRPGSLPVSAEEQCRRVLPVIEGLRESVPAPVSIDTTSAEVASAALDAGAAIVNDISGCTFDPEMVSLVARRGVPVIVMHTSDRPAVMQTRTDYADVCADVRAFLIARRDALVAAGVAPTQIVLDPGIGFGKTLTQNLLLLRDLPKLVAEGHPILVGTSRKRFLGELTGKDVDARDEATAASVAAAIVLGARLVRVHDVTAVMDAVTVADAIAHGGPVTG